MLSRGHCGIKVLKRVCPISVGRVAVIGTGIFLENTMPSISRMFCYRKPVRTVFSPVFRCRIVLVSRHGLCEAAYYGFRGPRTPPQSVVPTPFSFIIASSRVNLKDGHMHIATIN